MVFTGSIRILPVFVMSRLHFLQGLFDNLLMFSGFYRMIPDIEKAAFSPQQLVVRMNKGETEDNGERKAKLCAKIINRGGSDDAD
jgi:hypothetical protein